jgi:uncharacterized RDD family membrane protein YckC
MTNTYCLTSRMNLQIAFFAEMDESTELEYVGFWLRFLAGVVDALLLTAILFPLVLFFFGWDNLTASLHTGMPGDFLVAWLLPAILIFIVWTARNRTLGKMAISAVVLDERTSAPPSTAQNIGRYFGYFLAIIPFGLGLLWVAFDPKKQGWHDKLAGTIVVRPKPRR